jgi:hypothetical protein
MFRTAGRFTTAELIASMRAPRPRLDQGAIRRLLGDQQTGLMAPRALAPERSYASGPCASSQTRSPPGGSDGL